MGIQQGQSLNHWNYFLSIESDIEVISRFIEPCESNYETYSIELARILLASASEIDVLLKRICKQLEPDSNAYKIGQYEIIIKRHKSAVFDFKLKVPRWGLELTPWVDWTDKKPPLWWDAYNQVKHHRDTEYLQANLKNTLYSVGALFIINLYYYNDYASNAGLLPMQKLFRVEDRFFDGTTFNDCEFGINYKL